MAEPAERGRSRRSRSRRPGLAGLAVLLVLAGAAGLTSQVAARRGPVRASGARAATAPVVRTDLVNTIQVTGSLGYAGSFTVANALAGSAYTVLPPPGGVVRRGQRLYEVDGYPVVLFYGRRPEWRSLTLGVADGTDVAQLDANLIALGYATPASLIVSNTFTVATWYAVERWQAALGVPVTGTVQAGQIAYAPGPIRVTTVAAGLGTTPQPGVAVLTATSPEPVVHAALPVGQEYLVTRGDQVSVTLPNGTSTARGTVVAVSRVASAGSGGSGGAPAGPSAGGPGPSATVQLTVRLARPRSAGNLVQAPVTVNIVSAHARGVLAVPINALVALAGGGYAVDVRHGRGFRLTGVQTGLFGQSLVQVTGAGLRAGEHVQVPAP